MNGSLLSDELLLMFLVSGPCNLRSQMTVGMNLADTLPGKSNDVQA